MRKFINNTATIFQNDSWVMKLGVNVLNLKAAGRQKNCTENTVGSVSDDSSKTLSSATHVYDTQHYIRENEMLV